jgi:segregation and condensation protein B
MTQALPRILEAAILASHQPLSLIQLADLFDEALRPSHTELAQALESLSAACADRGVELVEVASGFRYQIKTEIYPHVARLWTERQSRYSRALLETLSLIAYRQPITRSEIEAVRGVAVSSHIIRTLEEREWIRVVGHREVPGRPALYGTTRSFLDYFKLKSLEDLPTLSEIKDLELDPELDFAPSTKPVNVELAPEQVANTQNLAQVSAAPPEQAKFEALQPSEPEHSAHQRPSEFSDAAQPTLSPTDAAKASQSDTSTKE